VTTCTGKPATLTAILQLSTKTISENKIAAEYIRCKGFPFTTCVADTCGSVESILRLKEESEEQCTVVFALIVMEPASE
jgi:hypothetical protein